MRKSVEREFIKIYRRFFELRYFCGLFFKEAVWAGPYT